MLRRRPSLALRAWLIFISIYLATVLAAITSIAIANRVQSGQEQHPGAAIALSFAGYELRRADETLRLSDDGYFSDLAARNPSLWLIGVYEGRSFSVGVPPDGAVRFLDQTSETLRSARLSVPGVEHPFAEAAVGRRPIGGASVLLAAGGVDPATLSPADYFRMIRAEGAFWMLGWIAAIGFFATLAAAPLLSRAVRPIIAQAALIDPQDPGRRLDEREAPRELLPLVRGFNAGLDRLSLELGRRKRFISHVAHEQRTPLAVVSLRVEALENEEARTDLRRAVGRLSHSVGEMLDLERLSLSGQQRRPLDLVTAARDVIADLAPMALSSGYELSLEAPDQPVMVRGDGRAVARAVVNLVRNAILHGGGAGDIRVVVHPAGTLDVSDEGPGVPAGLKPRLFEPFSRGSPETDGAGLGLHLTREIMRAHGGDVRLLTSLKGAVFRLEFPLHSGAAE